MAGPSEPEIAQIATGALVAPHALNFAQLYRLTSNLYSYRWDEAMRDNPQNALAMKREPFYLSLLQERWAPMINAEYQIEVEDENDPKQQVVRDGMARVWRDTPDKTNLLAWLLWAEWYGRSGQQGIWGIQSNKLHGWVYHEPVNGDGIQYQWDGTPVVLVHKDTVNQYQSKDKDAVVWSSDRGAYGLRLYKPEYRRRFVIHTHRREAADYFEGEMAGGVHGVGLRSWLYWSWWMRQEVLSWMFSFMQSTGMMDLLIFNFPQGNSEAEAAAIANAKKISGKLALVMPRPMPATWPAVEQIQMNTAGVDILKTLLEDFYDKHAERMIVGQSMSSGDDKSNSLGGTGRAEFAQDTKYQLVKMGAMALGETLTRDYIEPAKCFNFPWCEFPVWLKPVLPDPEAKDKVEAGEKVIAAGGTIEEDEFRKAAGYKKPRPNAKVLGGQQALGAAGSGSPGQGQPGGPEGSGPPPPETGDPFKDLFDGADEVEPDGYSYFFDESKHKRGNPKNAGQFGAGGSSGPTSAPAGRATNGKAPTPKVTDGAEPHPHDAKREGAKAHVRGLLARVKEVPGEIRERVTSFVKAKYEKLAERYGPAGAKMVLAGAVLLTPIPLPGTTLIPVALAEAVMRIRKLAVGRATKPVAQYADEEPEQFDLAAAVKEFLEELYKDAGEKCPKLDKAALAHVAEVLGGA